jgi:hypothetical protein
MGFLGGVNMSLLYFYCSKDLCKVGLGLDFMDSFQCNISQVDS